MTDKLAYTVAEAAEATGISRSRLFAHIKDNRLVARKDGRATLILRSELDRYLNSLPERA